MGNFEKLVLLTVLFVTAMIFGISMHQGDEIPTDPLGGLGGEELASLEEPAVDAAAAAAAERFLREEAARKERDEAAEDLALSSLVSTPPAVQPAPEPRTRPEAPTIGADSLLKTLAGLQRHPMGQDPAGIDLYVYTVKEGESLRKIAQTYYGSGSYAALLEKHNEGVVLQAGTTIVVPSREADVAAGTRSAFDAAPEHAAPAQAAPVTEVAATLGAAGSEPLKYTVRDGDSLWAIAAEVYGSGARWNDIYRANRDVLPNENALKIGMELRIP